MYLKSIEVQGFKSFANKIVFDFHNGITGIVGPNGSGKSNVADAVRWVLGEQSAKQLRGSKMEDVIFAGTENRKPVGFAFVSITLDNSDHALPVDYDEVTVSRRVYRSGESEYLINGNSCRLKDVTEMFYDTGIGKEGYSIIGQGQIDKILSGKPDERRELFDEAAGIVKFKRRKATAIKKLENERANLVRVNDILSELEKQVGPLQVQSEKAKEYLDYKADLKKYDVNAFLLESDRISKDLEELTGKIGIADNDLANSRAEYESTKAEYEEAEEQLSKVNSDIENVNSLLSNTELESQRLNGEINVITEQINRFTDNEKHYSDRIAAIDKDKAAKQTNVADFKKQLNELSTSVEEFENNLKAKQDTADVIKQDIDGVSDQIESRQNDIYDRLNAKSSINAENQKFATMLEQLNIRKAELNSHLIKDKSDEAEQNVKINDISVRLEAAQKNALDIAERIAANNNEVTAIKNENADLNAQHDKIVQNYHREKSRLESLVNITERYDGYGNSIRKIMELKDSNPGILGVIADIVKVERKYETAIETALGGTIQNIVTDKESTAKELIAYLKQNKLGRATFLPLNAISGRNTLEKEPCIKENGVIGIASNLVRVSFEYENLAKYLLGRILVVDNIDNLKCVFSDGTSASCSVKGSKSGQDIAVAAVSLSDISSDTASNIAIAELEDSSDIKVGQQVVAIGNALGEGQSVTTGIISAKDRSITVNNVTFTGLLMTDAAINSGNSGGALLNSEGKVIAINFAKTSSDGVEGMAYSIPVSNVKDIIDSLMTKQTRNKVSSDKAEYLGIAAVDITSNYASYKNCS